MFSRWLTTSLSCWAIVLLAGCSSLSLNSLLGPKVKFSSAERPANDIICMWDPSEGKGPDGKPARGFTGTVLFFDRTSTAPIGARGRLTFYVYDNYGPRETWSEPIAEYSFSAEEWDQFFTIGPLGPSYRIFIPYPRQHPYQVRTSLWVKFEPEDGRPGFYSQRAQIVLPGPLMEDDRIQILETTETRDRSPEHLQKIVANAYAEQNGSNQQDSRIQTLHRWETKPHASDFQLTNYEVTHGEPAGAYAGRSASVPGAAAESWGSTPPALSSTSASANTEPAKPRQRFKLGSPE